MNWLLVFIPITIVLERLAADKHVLLFVASAIAILPLAAWMRRATEQLAERMGGIQLPAVYLVFGITYFFLPDAVPQ